MRKIIGELIDDGPRQHIMECPECGDRFDMRDLGEVLAHEDRHAETQKTAPSRS